ncbi:MAG: DNA alkylation repair protein, partial [Anaerolineae bacterium]|nr:DNA alkylation repair protein [Anaerolineae bacterium]
MTHPLTRAIKEELAKVRDPEKAPAMQAYMKSDQPFLGVQAGPRKEAFKAAVAPFKQISRADYEQVIFELWQGTYREEMYQALEVAERYKAYRTKESWPIYERLVRTATNWDTLDWIAGKLISPLILKHRDLEKELRRWASDENFWVRRAALLAHLRHKDQTNTELLAELILLLCHEQEFFIRKAIGWVLREYSSVNPAWVQAFVAQHAD